MSMRWMQFIDGENLTIRAQAVAEECDLDLSNRDYFVRDTFVWKPGYKGGDPLIPGGGIPGACMRSYYFASTTGAEDVQSEIREKLHRLGFDPRVFHKDRGTGRSKGVDIALATEMLGHAHRQNCASMVLVAGDGDYLPLVDELKRLGIVIHVQFFRRFTSDKLRLAADSFQDVTEEFERRFPRRKPAAAG